jgi:hypothetical protein
MGRFNQSGKRLEPGIDVASGGAVRKSAREGPESNVSVNDVVGRRVPEGEMVARHRIEDFEGREDRDEHLDTWAACSRRGRYFMSVGMMLEVLRSASTNGDNYLSIQKIRDFIFRVRGFASEGRQILHW